MKTILMVAYPFPPNQSAGAVRSERFSRYLGKLGWRVQVVTPKQNDGGKAGRDKSSGDRNIEIHYTSTVDPWLKLKDQKIENLFLRFIKVIIMVLFSFPDHMLLWVPYAVKKGMELRKNGDYDVIYTTSPPHTSHLAGLLLSVTSSKPWVADFRDPWTVSSWYKVSKATKLRKAIERALERLVYSRVNLLIANTEANRKNTLEAFPHLNPEKVIVVPNGWEDEGVSSEIRRNQKGFLIIAHAGTFYPGFEPYGLLIALSAWRRGKGLRPASNLRDKIRVILLGARDDATRKVVEDLEIGDIVEFKPWVELAEARRIMSDADLLWATLGTKEASSTYIPSKLLEYIGARRPIIGFFPEGEAANLIRRTGTGVVFTTEDSGAVIRLLSEALENREEWGLSIYKPNREVIDSLRIENIVKQLDEAINELLD